MVGMYLQNKKSKVNFIFFMNDLYWNTFNVLIIKCNR